MVCIELPNTDGVTCAVKVWCSMIMLQSQIFCASESNGYKLIFKYTKNIVYLNNAIWFYRSNDQNTIVLLPNTSLEWGFYFGAFLPCYDVSLIWHHKSWFWENHGVLAYQAIILKCEKHIKAGHQSWAFRSTIILWHDLRLEDVPLDFCMTIWPWLLYQQQKHRTFQLTIWLRHDHQTLWWSILLATQRRLV